MLKLKLQYFGQLMGTADEGEADEGQRGQACRSPWGCKESDTTGQLNKTNKKGLGS